MWNSVIRNYWIVCSMLALATAASAQPQTPQRGQGAPPAAAPPAEAAEPQTVQPTEPAGARAASPQNRPPSDLEAVAARLSRSMGKQFVIDPRLRGNDFGAVDNDEVDYDLLLSLLRVQDATAIEAEDVVYVIPEPVARLYATPIVQRDVADLHGATWVARVLTTANVDASQMLGVLRPLASQAATMAIFPPNKLLIVERYDNVKRISEIVRMLDQR
jgi:general secretion pathway protein D